MTLCYLGRERDRRCPHPPINLSFRGSAGPENSTNPSSTHNKTACAGRRQCSHWGLRKVSWTLRRVPEDRQECGGLKSKKIFSVTKACSAAADNGDFCPPTSAGSSKKQESSRKTSISALLTMPKPLTVWITINWKILKEMGIPDHLIYLLRNLYAGQEATIRTGHGTTDWFQIGNGVRQGCILSTLLI